MFSNQLVGKFKKLWDGIDCLLEPQLQLHMEPKAKKYNSLLVHQREKVENLIQKLVDVDIIERVTDDPTDPVTLLYILYFFFLFRILFILGKVQFGFWPFFTVTRRHRFTFTYFKSPVWF